MKPSTKENLPSEWIILSDPVFKHIPTYRYLEMFNETESCKSINWLLTLTWDFICICWIWENSSGFSMLLHNQGNLLRGIDKKTVRRKCISICILTLYNVILRIARNLLETNENIKIESHSFCHIICDWFLWGCSKFCENFMDWSLGQ